MQPPSTPPPSRIPLTPTVADSWPLPQSGRVHDFNHARVAELADAQDSGSCARKGVGVQVPPRAPWVGETTQPNLMKKPDRAGGSI